MNYLIIRFPFSSVNDEQYMLAVCLHNPVTLQPVMDVLNADSQVFTPGLSYTDGTDNIYNYTGTLQGSVQVVDDERDDFYEPIVASKLSFNMAYETFPEWLMQYCDMRWASVILYKDNATNVELWRGYLVAQSLNMTVVRDKLACSMVAVDEIGMAKYMPLNKTLITGMHTLLIGVIMEMFHNIHYYQGFTLYGINGIGFDRYYQLLGLTQSNAMLWHRNMALVNDDGDELDDLPAEMIVNLDRWLNDDKATWHDVFDAVFRYLGVTLCMGGWQGLGANDAYVLSCPTDGGSIKQYSHYFGSGSTEITGSQFAELVNPFKIGGDLQVTVEPNRYKSVTINSTPHRWDSHAYLTNEHYKEIAPNKEVKYEWGEMENHGAGPFTRFAWHKLKYIKPDAQEAEFVEIAPCQDGEGYLMARSGELPCVDLTSCEGKTEPDSDVADTLDFITFKEGCCCVKIGQGETDGIDEDSQLNNYFLIMNHNWGNMYAGTSTTYHTMQTLHLADTVWLTLWPLGNDKPLHPSESHYLQMKLQVKFIRENIPSGIDSNYGRITFLYLKAPDAQTPNQIVDWSTPAIIMPSDTSYHDFAMEGILNASLNLWYDLYFKAYIHIGHFYYNGTTWVHVASGETPPKCDVTLWNDTNEISSVTNIGQRVIITKSYYYTVGNPYRGSNLVDRYTKQTKLLTDLGQLSIPGQELEGKLEIQVLGQIRLQAGTFDIKDNSIPFVLIDGIDINYTDEAELIGKDIANKATVYMDYYSQTKEEMVRDIEMASPSVPGFFDNTLLYDGGKAIHNLATVIAQGGSSARQPEQMLASQLGQQYSDGQCFVELSTPIHYDDNLHNVGFVVKGLTEVGGTFLPVKRTFDYRMERLRVKLQRVNVADSD